ncbi:MAG: hypothetical protein P4M11_03715 [Candidatus Pacebacteria bacterium]|nr:hypothetical protein [Candidatus Paceibacterota bacterium]
MLYSTNIIAVVGLNERAVFTPRRLTIWDTNTQTSRMDFSFNSLISYVKMNKQRYEDSVCDIESRLVVATQYNIDVYNLLNMHKLFSIDIDGSLVRLALTPGQTSCYLAYTANLVQGDVTVYDLISCTKQLSISAHRKPVIQMKFNPKGNMLATASSDVSRIRATRRGKRYEYSRFRTARSSIACDEACT